MAVFFVLRRGLEQDVTVKSFAGTPLFLLQGPRLHAAGVTATGMHLHGGGTIGGSVSDNFFFADARFVEYGKGRRESVTCSCVVVQNSAINRFGVDIAKLRFVRWADMLCRKFFSNTAGKY